jgi:hypothetical protein
MSTVRVSPPAAVASRGLDTAARIACAVIDDALRSADTTAMAAVEWSEHHRGGSALAALIGVGLMLAAWLWQRPLAAVLRSAMVPITLIGRSPLRPRRPGFAARLAA